MTLKNACFKRAMAVPHALPRRLPSLHALLRSHVHQKYPKATLHLLDSHNYNLRSLPYKNIHVL